MLRCRPLNKSVFRTHVMDAELIVEVPRQRPGPNRPAQIYRLKYRRNAVFFPRTFSPCSTADGQRGITTHSRHTSLEKFNSRYQRSAVIRGGQSQTGDRSTLPL